MRAVLDAHRCIGAGNCIFLAPTAFRWRVNEPAKAELLDISTVDEEVLQEAAMSCPTAAIMLYEDESEPGVEPVEV